MIDSVPSRARRTAPETGASTSVLPAFATVSASARVRIGSLELMSITKLPGASTDSTPGAPGTPGTPATPRIVASTSFELGSMVMTIDAPFAASTGEVAAVAPNSCASRCTTAASMSNSDSAWPASASRRAIGWPIVPRPMKAMRSPAFVVVTGQIPISLNTSRALRKLSIAAGTPQ